MPKLTEGTSRSSTKKQSGNMIPKQVPPSPSKSDLFDTEDLRRIQSALEYRINHWIPLNPQDWVSRREDMDLIRRIRTMCEGE